MILKLIAKKGYMYAICTANDVIEKYKDQNTLIEN